MPQQTPTPRPSLNISLEQRYATQNVGGAFDAKDVKNQPIDPGFQDKQFETPAIVDHDTFNDKALNFVDSMGFSNKKYKP